VETPSFTQRFKERVKNTKDKAFRAANSLRDTVRVTARKGSDLAKEILGRSLNKTGGYGYGYSNVGSINNYYARQMMFKGLASIYETRSRLFAAAKFDASIKQGILSSDELKKIQIQALKRGKELKKNPSATLSTTSEMMKLRNITPRKRDVITGLAKYSLAGTGRIVKPHSHAILNPRVLGTAALGIGSIAALSFVNRKGEALRTTGTGSGRFGKDSSGILGPAALEGMRFKSHKKRMRI
jgi:hypothetical protein